MSTTRNRIARLTAASALAVGLGVLGAGPALADAPSGWSWSVPDSSTAAEDDATPDCIPHGRGCLLISDDGTGEGDQVPNDGAGAWGW